MDKEIILDYKKASGKSLIDSFIKYKTTSLWDYLMITSIYEFRNDCEKALLFGTPTINIK